MPASFVPSATDYLAVPAGDHHDRDWHVDHAAGTVARGNKKNSLSGLTVLGVHCSAGGAVMANGTPGTSFSNMLIVDGFATFFRVL